MKRSLTILDEHHLTALMFTGSLLKNRRMIIHYALGINIALLLNVSFITTAKDTMTLTYKRTQDKKEGSVKGIFMDQDETSCGLTGKPIVA